MLKILQDVEILNTVLQKRKKTLWEAMIDIKDYKQNLKDLRCEQVFHDVWEKSRDFCVTNNIQMEFDTEMDTTQRKKKRKESQNNLLITL